MKFSILLLIIIVVVGCALQKSANVDLGSGFRLITSASKHDLIIGKWLDKDTDKVFIPGHITDYAYDSVFILAAQCPRDSVPEASYNNPGITLKKHDQIFKQSKFRQYWIIDKEKTSVYGPFKLNDFNQKRNELRIPRGLRLKDTSEQ
jgi:hypothetical protein